MTNWVKINRSIRENWLWNDKPFDRARAWIDLIVRANFKDKMWLCGNTEILIPRGSLVTSVLKLQQDWGWSREQIRGYFRCLTRAQMATIYTTNKYTHIFITNYDSYQTSNPSEQPSEQPINNQQTTNGQLQLKNDKEGKNVNNTPLSPPTGGKPRKRGDPKYRDFSEQDFMFPPKWGTQARAALKRWVEFKSSAGHPITKISYQGQVDRFADNPQFFAKLVERARSKPWQGLNEEIPFDKQNPNNPPQQDPPRVHPKPVSEVLPKPEPPPSAERREAERKLLEQKFPNWQRSITHKID